MANHTCCFVLRPARFIQTKGMPAGHGVMQSAKYCSKPTGYVMATHEDGSRYRKYAAFCEEHDSWGDDDEVFD